MRWEELRKHPFWGDEIASLPLPNEPIFEAYLATHGINPKNYYAQKVQPQENKGELDSTLPTTNSNKTDKKADILRLSQTVKKNTFKGSEYHSNEKDSKAQHNDVHISNKDQDLNFGENSDDEEQEHKACNEAVSFQKISPHKNNLSDVPMASMSNINVQKNSMTKKLPVEEESKQNAPFTKGVEIGAHMDAGGYIVDTSSPKPIEDLILNTTDTSVKPIIGNKDIEKAPDPVYDHTLIPFQVIKAEVLEEKINAPEFDKHLSLIFQAIATNTDINKSNNLLLYFESLIMNSSASNKIINTDYMLVLCKLLESIGNPLLKIRLCSIIGYLIRHATTIKNEISQNGLINVLISLFNDSNIQLRRKAISTAGEYLFYASTQLDDSQYERCWEIKSAQYEAFLKCLRSNDDQIAKAYALKTIENILSQSTNGGLKFLTEQIYSSLITIFKSSEQENIKVSAAVALMHLCKLDIMANMNNGYINLILSDIGIITLSTLLVESSQKMQQSILTIMLLIFHNSYKKIESTLLETKQFLSSIAATLESSNPVIKGKSLLILTILISNNYGWLIKFKEHKLSPIIDKLVKENTKYTRQTLNTYITVVADSVSIILIKCNEDLQELLKYDKLKENPMEIFTPKLSTKLEGHHCLLPAIAEMFTASVYKLSIVNNKFILSLCKLLELSDYKQYASQNELKQAILRIIEGISKATKALMINKDSILQNMIPALSSQFKSANLDTRCECLKLFMTIIIQFLNEEAIYDPKSNNFTTKAINEKIIKQLLPYYGNILIDKEPMPLFGLALLNAILEKNQAFVALLDKLKLIDIMFEYFTVGNPKMNTNIVKIIKIIIESKEISLSDLCALNAYAKLANAIQYMIENQIDDTAEDLIEAAISVMKQFDELYRIELVKTEGIPDSLANVFKNIRQLALPLSSISAYIRHDQKELVDKSTQYIILVLQLFNGNRCKGVSDIKLKSEHVLNMISGLDSDSIVIQKRLVKCILYGLTQKEEPVVLDSVHQEALKEKLSKLSESEDKSIITSIREIMKKLT